MPRLRSRIRSRQQQQQGGDRKSFFGKIKRQEKPKDSARSSPGRRLLVGCILSLLVFGLVVFAKEHIATFFINNINSSTKKDSVNNKPEPKLLRTDSFPKSYFDSAQKYIRLCNPQPTSCNKTLARQFSSHGIGNALMTRYSKEAESVIESTGCTPILDDIQGNKGYFRLLDYVEIPHGIPQLPPGHTNVDQQFHKKCIVHALTQPLPRIQQKLDEVLLKQQQDLPLVALHMRTGWADETARRKKFWDKFTPQVCSKAFSTQSKIDPPTIYDTGSPSFDLDIFLNRLRDQANTLYGKNQWRFFVASDSPYMKEYTSNYLKDSYAGEKALMTHGLIWHNFNGAFDRTPEENQQINENLMVDLIALSEASFLAHFPSKFPGSAAIRSMCLEKTLTPEASGFHPRHDLASLGGVAKKYVESPWFDNEREGFLNSYKDPKGVQTSLLLKDIVDLLPKNSSSACVGSEQSIMACLCWVKQSHERG